MIYFFVVLCDLSNKFSEFDKSNNIQRESKNENNCSF